MGKGTNFSGQPIFTQLLNLLDKSKITKASKALGADKYVKRFTSHKHIVVMLFVAFEGYNSIRETVLGLLSNAHRLGHLGLDYVVRRSTLSEANARRTPDIFARVYYDTYQRYSGSLAIKAHTITRSEDNQPRFIRYTEAAKHDHLLFKEFNFPENSILCFDKGYEDYSQYEVFTRKSIWYVTRLKDNALYQARKEFDIPNDDST